MLNRIASERLFLGVYIHAGKADLEFLAMIRSAAAVKAAAKADDTPLPPQATQTTATSVSSSCCRQSVSTRALALVLDQAFEHVTLEVMNVCVFCHWIVYTKTATIKVAV